MVETDEKQLLVNACSVLLYDLSHIIWLQEISNNMRREKEKDLILFSREEEFSFIVYKCFQKQLKNLQKYSALITKFRDIELFIDETEDNMANENFMFYDNLFQQLLHEVKILKKCQVYSLNMGSIMLRAMPKDFPVNHSVKATIVQMIKTDKYECLKNEIVEVVEMESKVSWKIRNNQDHYASISPLFLKLHSNNAEGKIIEKLLERMDNLLNVIYDSYRNIYLQAFPKYDITNRYLCDYIDSIKCTNGEDLCIPQYWNKNFQSLKKSYTILKTSITYQTKIRDNCFSSSINEKNFKLSLRFQIQISEKNITNEEKLEKLHQI